MDTQRITKQFNHFVGKPINVLEGKRKTSIDRNDPVLYQIQSLAKEFGLQVKLTAPGMMTRTINYQSPYQRNIRCLKVSIDKESNQRYKVQNFTLTPRTI